MYFPRFLARIGDMRKAVGASPLIILDFDGVVADSLEEFSNIFSSVCHDLGYMALTSREAFLKLFDGNAVFALMRRGFTIKRLKQLGAQFAKQIEEANLRIQPFKGMPEVVTSLARLHPVYVITSNNTPTILNFLRRHAIEGILDVMGADKEASKVKKIRDVMKRHPCCRPYYIGDTTGDMREARRAGAVPVAVSWGFHSVERLKKGRPDVIVDSPESLKELFV